ncbi:hypothetical protein HK104_001427, partial [Borealophlyctis nickersoniae]
MTATATDAPPILADLTDFTLYDSYDESDIGDCGIKGGAMPDPVVPSPTAFTPVTQDQDGPGDQSSPTTATTRLALPSPPVPPVRRRGKNMTKAERDAKRLERIQRNRAAAHASRERKRKHQEELEFRNISLLTQGEHVRKRLRASEAETAVLMARLEAMSKEIADLRNGVVATISGDR